MRHSALALTLVLLTVQGFADPLMWDRRGVPVTMSGRVEWGQTAATNPEGYAVTTWSDMHSGSREVYAQLIDPSGNMVWGDGLQLTNDVHEQSLPLVVAADGGWIVAWVDYRNHPRSSDDDFGGEIWLQKLNNTGVELWTAGGVRAAGSAQIERGTLRMASDQAGGVVLSWIGRPVSDLGVYATRINSEGTGVWWLAVCDAEDIYGEIKSSSDESGGLILGWSTRTAIQTCRIRSDGAIPWGVVNVRNQLSGNLGSSIASDGSGGCFMAWYVALDSSAYDIYAQYVNSAGHLQWPSGGVLVCGAPELQSYPTISVSRRANAIDGCLLAWFDHRYIDQASSCFTQKLDFGGFPIWAADGILLADSVMPYRSVNVLSDGAGGLVATWEDERQSYQGNYHAGRDIRAIRLNSAGNRVWPGEIAPVCLADGDQWIPSIVPVGNNYLVLFQNGQFSDEIRGMGYQILNAATGAAVLPANGITLIDRPVQNLWNAFAAPISGGRTAIIWRSERVHYQILNAQGETELNSDSSLILPDTAGMYSDFYNAYTSQAFTDGQGGFFALLNSGDEEIGYQAFLAHISSEGQILGNGKARPFWDGCEIPYDACESGSADHSGGAYVAFQLWAPVYGLYVMHVNSNCEPLWAVPTLLDTIVSYQANSAQVVTASDGSCIIARQTATHLCRLSRVADNGSILWSVDLNDIPTVGAELFPRLEADDQGGAYCAWIHVEYAVPYQDIRVQHVNANGDQLWAHGGLTVSTLESYRSQCQSVLDNFGNLIVVWLDDSWEQGPTDGIRAQKFSPTGTRLWSDSGRTVCSMATALTAPVVVGDGGDGAFVSWANIRTEPVPPHICATHLNGDGYSGPDGYWVQDVGGRISDSSATVHSTPVLVPADFNSAVVLWEQDIGQSADVTTNFYTQRMAAQGVGISDRAEFAATRYTLHQNYPNPFNPVTEIRFDLSRSTRVELRVFDLLGQHVATLVDAIRPAGTNLISWNGQSASGSPVASGVYIYQLKAGSFTESKKMILLR